MDKVLYVPVILDVLLVGDEDRGYADVGYDYSVLDEDTLFGDMVSNRGFGEVRQMSGAHLQWTMPDALLHGKKREDGSLEFPVLPNRFLIQRLKVDGDELSWKGWLLRSDFVTNDSYQTMEGMRKTVIPALKYDPAKRSYEPAGDDGKMYAFVGSVRPFGEEETEKEKWKLPMTAVGLGDPLTTAYYPLAKTVIGFYDSMADGDGTYTYLVCGYYEDKEQAPLSGDAVEVMKKFGWKPDTDDEVEQCLFYGISRSVVWKGKTRAYADIPTEEVRIDIGNTSMETMASLLGSRFPEDEGVERMLHALPYGLLALGENDSQSDSLIRMEEHLHATQFNQLNGGTKWVVRVKHEKEDSFGEWKLDEELYQAVVALNEINDKKYECQEDLQSASQELYSFWYQYVQFKLAAPGDEKLPDRKRQVQELTEQILTQREQYLQFDQEITERAEKLKEPLEMKKMYLEEIPGQYYYEPVPPVLMLSGDGVKRSFRQGHQKDDGEELRVRTNPASGLTISEGETELLLSASDVMSALSVPDTLPAPAARILGECLLCGEEMIPFLVRVISQMSGKTLSGDLVREAQRKISRSALGDRAWKQPWNPLLLLWNVSVLQAVGTEGKDSTFHAFSLSDLDWEKKNEFTGKEQNFQGLSLLTPNGVTQMSRGCRQIMKKKKKNFGKLEERLKQMENASVLSQQMSGFYEAFSALSDMPVLPVISPDEETKELAGTVSECLEGYPHMPVLGGEGSPFLPVRGGILRMNRLRLIDSFGQYKEIGIFSHNVHVSETMKGDRGTDVLLRPRFLQPVRVEFDWLSAEHEQCPCLDGNSTPVAGFLVPDFLDRCLFVYDNEGHLLGAAQDSEERICWMGGMGICQTAENISNPYLKNFVTGLLERKPENMKLLLEYLRNCLTRSVTGEQMEMLSMCFGRTLALCRAKVSLKGKGRLLRQLFDDTCTTRDYEKEKVFIRLGDERKLRNGLLGYAKENGSPCRVLHVLEKVEQTGDDYLDSCHDLSLSLEDGERNLLFLMLPEGEVSVRAGFVPAMSKSLQKEMYEDRQAAIEHIFRLAPFLAGGGKILLPQEQILGEEWVFSFLRGEEEKHQNISKRGIDFREEEKSLMEGILKQKGKDEEKKNAGIRICSK